MEKSDSCIKMDKPRILIEADKDAGKVFKLTKAITFVGLPVALGCMYTYSAPMGVPFVCATLFATTLAAKAYQLVSGSKKFIKSIEILEDGERVRMIDLEGKEFVIAVKDF